MILVCDKCKKEHDSLEGATVSYVDGTEKDLCNECYEKSLDE